MKNTLMILKMMKESKSMGISMNFLKSCPTISKFLKKQNIKKMKETQQCQLSILELKNEFDFKSKRSAPKVTKRNNESEKQWGNNCMMK